MSDLDRDFEVELVGDTPESFVTVSITVSGHLPEDVVAAIRGVLDALRAGSAE